MRNSSCFSCETSKKSSEYLCAALAHSQLTPVFSFQDADLDDLDEVEKAGGDVQVEYALKTLKTLVNAIVDYWKEQEDNPVPFRGGLVSRGADHPRSEVVKHIPKNHRVSEPTLTNF